MSLMALAALFQIPVYAATAEPVPSDLGSNLAYIRIHSLADSASALQSALAPKHACVLDLRHVVSTEESVGSLRAALAAHSGDAALYILISPSTPADVIDAVNTTPGPYVTLGVANPNLPPKVTVNATTEEDRQAYDAFESGTPITDLISGKIEKERYDEATLVQEFKNGDTNPPELLTPDPTKPKTETTGGKPSESTAPAAAPLRDKVLQRALNLHQALLALRR